MPLELTPAGAAVETAGPTLRWLFPARPLTDTLVGNARSTAPEITVTTQPKPDPPETGWTVDDYMQLEPDDHRHELIRGRLIVTPSPTFEHQSILSNLSFEITAHVKEHDLGSCVQAPCDVVLADDTVLQPDFIFVATDHLDDLRDGHALTGAPDLVAEVLSPETARRDRTEKREIYADAGVPWFLIVEPKGRVVEVFQLQNDGNYAVAATAADDDVLSFDLFPDFELDLSDLWFDPLDDTDRQ